MSRVAELKWRRVWAQVPSKQELRGWEETPQTQANAEREGGEVRLLGAFLFLPTISIPNHACSLFHVALAHHRLAQTEGLMMEGGEAFVGVGLGLDCDCGRLNTER